MPYYFMDSTYFLFILPALILGMVAQFMVKNRFQKYSKIRAGSGYTGEAAATRILRENQLHDVRVEQAPGSLTDHYRPKEIVLRLSDATFAGCADRVVSRSLSRHFRTFYSELDR